MDHQGRQRVLPLSRFHDRGLPRPDPDQAEESASDAGGLPLLSWRVRSLRNRTDRSTRHDLRSLSHAELQRHHEAFPASAAELLDIERSFEQRSLRGGTARATVAAAIAEIEAELDAESARLEETARAMQEPADDAEPAGAAKSARAGKRRGK